MNYPSCRVVRTHCNYNPCTCCGQEVLSSTLPHYPSVHYTSAFSLVYLITKGNGGKRSKQQRSQSRVRIKRKKSLALFIFLLFYSHFLQGVEEGRGSMLYSNCAGEVRMIAFYCPLSPQVSARKVLCVLRVERETGETKHAVAVPLL